MEPFAFACPRCRSPLQAASPDALACPREEVTFLREAGVWRFLLPERRAFFERFVREYELIRRAEGRGSPNAAYYRALPFADLSRLRSEEWRLRARSFRAFVERIVEPLEDRLGRPMKVLEAGAGNGWLSYRLAQRGHQVAAVDLLVNDFDGLGCWVYYDAPFTPVQAEFDRLPFVGDQFDLIVYNASLHYSVDYTPTLCEGGRVLSPDGQLAILDTPVYADPSSGEKMVIERQAAFTERYGFPSNALPSEQYLTLARLEELAAQPGLTWQVLTPFYGARWAARPLLARLLRRREPARFLILRAGRPRARSIAGQGFDDPP